MHGGVKMSKSSISRAYELVPEERIGAVIGQNGKVKEMIEQATSTNIKIESNTGIVYIEPRDENTKADSIIKAKEIIRAIAIGFTPEEAFRLLDEDQILIVINLKEINEDPNGIKRIKSRIIGEEGRTRKIIEETTGSKVVIGESAIGIIGDFDQASIAERAIRMLIDGKPHSVVYSYLEREARRLKKRRITGLWKTYGEEQGGKGL
ncbi:RNA-processing protein [Fervidicoccus fontis]|uniref:RNA-processing protein n=2 Tax=Fervidicoccaceae TaxID=685949 RepID=A0A7C2Z2I8_9CREN|nr:RNA-processing protein [Fervidicoccus fontis]HEW63777.1 RNA-processing protein [Fervidicoccus fontis]